MFQPLLDAYIESTQIEETTHKPPLKIAVANWWGNEEMEEFKKSVLYFILSQRYTITLHQNPDKPADIVFCNPLDQPEKSYPIKTLKGCFTPVKMKSLTSTFLITP